jgi:hypothetical protein
MLSSQSLISRYCRTRGRTASRHGRRWVIIRAVPLWGAAPRRYLCTFRMYVPQPIQERSRVSRLSLLLSLVLCSVIFQISQQSRQSALPHTRRFLTMACITLALVAGWASSVSGLMQFINPPPFGAMRDFSNSETYSVGSTLNVAWTPAESGKAASLVLYQLDSNGLWFGDMEYLTRRYTLNLQFQ